MGAVRAYAHNTFAKHPAYPKIMEAYNERLKRTGKVNAKLFHEEIVSKEIPGYALSSWYGFLKRFKTENGLHPIQTLTHAEAQQAPAAGEAEAGVVTTMLSNQDALQRSIARALNISAAALEQVMNEPDLIPAEKRAELFLKVMKAQDSRVKAIGAMRADTRAQEAFDRAMDSAAYA